MDQSATPTPIPRSTQIRQRLIWTLWLITELGLLAGLVHPQVYAYVVYGSILHVLLFICLDGWDLVRFPVQLRLAFVAWVALGTYIPELRFLLWIPTIGVAANLVWGYCPLARLLTLLPMNRDEPLSWGLAKRIVLTPPVSGRFVPTRDA